MVRLTEIDCPVCGSASSKLLFFVKDYGRRISDERFGVRRCRECGCGYLSPRPSEDEIARFYDESYFWSHEGHAGPISPEEVVAKRKSQLEAKAACLRDMSPGRLLDIGAQKGEFLWFMAQRGWRVEGVEISDRVLNQFGEPIRYGDFLTMNLPVGAYDCITMWAVLEHVYQPRAFARKVSGLLRPGGRFVALVTNFNSVQGRWFRGDDYPRHLTFFTRRSLTRLLTDVGLNVRSFWTDQKCFGGSLHGGFVFGTKLLFGYSAEEIFHEWRQDQDPLLFCCKWRGKPSSVMRQVSRIDRAVTLLPEKFLDLAGFGFNMCVIAEKPATKD
jgi:SAM-dependent methyltransferase